MKLRQQYFRIFYLAFMKQKTMFMKQKKNISTKQSMLWVIRMIPTLNRCLKAGNIYFITTPTTMTTPPLELLFLISYQN